MKKNTLILCFVISFLAGCSLVPYENEFACRKKDQMGKCISMQEAYEEAVTGLDLHPNMRKASDGDSNSKSSSDLIKNSSFDDGGNAQHSYIDSYYNEITSIIDKPVTPVVKHAKTVRTLILPYTSNDNSLFMERFVYTIIKEPEFVLGQYLTKQEKMIEPIIKPRQQKGQ